MAIWIWDEYYEFSIATVSVTLASCLITSIITKLNLKYIHKLLNFAHKARVLRQFEEYVITNESQVYPGDIIDVTDGVCSYDIILLSGSCFVNESNITGEPYSVLKTSIPDNEDIFSYTANNPSVIYAGSVILSPSAETNAPIRGLVIKIGFHTKKGRLLSALLYERDERVKLTQDYLYVIIGLISFAAIAYFCCIPKFAEMAKVGNKQIYLQIFVLITISCSPLTPTALSLTIFLAIIKLRKSKIFCINPSKVCIAGLIDTMLFDKTGTITDSSSKVAGYYFNRDAKTNMKQLKRLNKDDAVNNYLCSMIKKLDQKKADISLSHQELFLESLASCHSLLWKDKKLEGDPQELEMLKLSGWAPEENKGENEKYRILLSLPLQNDITTDTLDSPIKIGIVSIYEFNSETKRMSTIVHRLIDDTYRIYCKGSPETIKNACIDSSLPVAYDHLFSKFSSMGYRVLAVCTKDIIFPYPYCIGIARENIEKDMEFLGFLFILTSIKPDSQSVIKELNEAGIRNIMITGDNIYTSTKVALDSSLIDSQENIYMGLMKNNTLKWTIKCGQAFEDKMEVDVDVINLERENDSPRKHMLPYDHLPPIILNVPKGSQPTKIEQEQNLHNSLFMQKANNQIELSGCEENPGSTIIIPDMNNNQPWKSNGNNYAIAMTEEALFYYFKKVPLLKKDDIKLLLGHLKVVARATIYGKSYLIDLIKTHQKSIVGMCGDGSNDQAALENADVGFALVSSEVNISSSFYTTCTSISCVPAVIKEGRQCLVSSFQNFKFMALYSIIQLMNFVILIYRNTDLTAMQYLTQDLMLMFPSIIITSWQLKLNKISAFFPKERFINSEYMIEICIQVVINLLGSVIILHILSKFPFYAKTAMDPNGKSLDLPNMDNTVICQIGCMEIVAQLLVYNIEGTFRISFYKNPLIVIWLTLAVGGVVGLIFLKGKVIDFFGSLESRKEIRLLMVIGGITILLLAIVTQRVLRIAINRIKRKKVI